MEIIYIKDNFINPQNCAATIGFFDGMHLGHQFLLNELKTAAAQNKLKSALITFSEHPRHVLQKTDFPPLLTTLDEKISLIEKTGIDFCFVLNFTKDMAQLSAEDFISTILKKQLNADMLLVGYDHHFGHNRNETFDDYFNHGKKHQLAVIQAKAFAENKELRISSSNIRYALIDGNVETANKMLSYPYTLRGKVIDGYKIGRKIGFPTANIELIDKQKIIPGKGVYAVNALIKHKKYRGMMNIGSRPTIDNGNTISLEVHIINFSNDIYNEDIQISFIKKMRDEIKFQHLDELIKQLNEDRKMILELPDTLFL